MKLSAEQREALAGRGVTLDGDEPTVEDGLTALLSVEVTEPVEPTANDVPHLLSVDADAERYFSAWHKAEADKVEAEIKVACEDGRLSADMAEAVKTLLGVSQGYSLSAEGKAEAVDVPALVRTILSAIPAKAVVPVGEEVTAAAAGNDPGAHPPVEVKEFGPADVAETVKRMAARVPEVK